MLLEAVCISSDVEWCQHQTSEDQDETDQDQDQACVFQDQDQDRRGSMSVSYLVLHAADHELLLPPTTKSVKLYATTLRAIEFEPFSTNGNWRAAV